MSDSDSSSSSGPDVNAPLKKVNIKDIKGRWLHCDANIGLITVNPAESHAILTDGTIWELSEKGNTVMMEEYAIVPRKSTLSELVWVNTVDRYARRYKWFFEDDGDIELDFAPPQLGKRQLIPEDVASDDYMGSDSDSDDDDVCSEGNEKPEMDSAYSVPRVVELFTEWILSTNTVAHEKRLARQGHLSKEFPVRVRGGGIRSLEAKLAALGVTHEHINHRKTGTLIILKEAARKKFIDKHPEHQEHFAHREQGETTPKRRKMDASIPVEVEPSPLADVEALQQRLIRANSAANDEAEVYDTLLEMEQLVITPDLLRKTKIGLCVNDVAKEKTLPESVRGKAGNILQAWKKIFRAEKRETTPATCS